MNAILFISLLSLLIAGFIRSSRGRSVLYCGLFGFSGREKVDISKFKMGLWENQARGKHSTGVYGNKIFKRLQAAEDFIAHHRALMDAAHAHEVLGHTRYATMGEKSEDNAHPYEYGKIVGTHNGWCVNTADTCETYGVEMPAVDSQLIYKIFEATDYDFTTIGSHIGQMALAFVMDDKLHLYRRHNKPLFIGRCPEGIYYSSREEALQIIGADGIGEVEPDIMFVFQRGVMVDAIEIPEAELDIPADAKPYNWRTHVKNSEAFVPLTADEKKFRGGATAGKATTSTTTKTSSTPPATTTAATTTTTTRATAGNAGVDTKDTQGGINEEKSYPMRVEDTHQRQGNFSNFSTVVLKVMKDDGTNMSESMLMTSLHLHQKHEVSVHGYVSLNVNERFFGDKVTMVLKDPWTGYIYHGEMTIPEKACIQYVDIIVTEPVVEAEVEEEDEFWERNKAEETKDFYLEQMEKEYSEVQKLIEIGAELDFEKPSPNNPVYFDMVIQYLEQRMADLKAEAMEYYYNTEGASEEEEEEEDERMVKNKLQHEPANY